MLKNKRIRLFLITVLLFVLLLPIAATIDFYQNDDWCYYQTVQNFLEGNFTLHPYVGPTLYLQAFLGAGFAKVFGIAHLPVLTLLAACAALYVFLLILTEHLKVSFKWSLIFGTLFFSNLLGVYELWGFMTNHYFMFFLLLGLYFFLKFEESGKKLYLMVYLLATFCALLIRQVALVFPLSASIYYFFKKSFKLSALNFLVFAAMYAFYSYLLPLTPRMIEVQLQPHHFLDFDYTYAVIYGSLIILSAYLFPLLINSVDLKILSRSPKNLIIYAVAGVALFVGLNGIFKPDTISWGEFPYFENVVERTGFYPRSVHGTKYYFAGNFDLWRFWDLASKIVLSAFLVLNFKRLIKTNNIFGWFVATYLVMTVATETYYDRYIYVMVPISIFYLLTLNNNLSKFAKVTLTGFLLLQLYLAYLFSVDFILVNKYIWNRSKLLVAQRNVSPNDILGANAWKLTYKNPDKSYRFNFSYDSQSVNSDYAQKYKLIEEKTINFPLNIFVNPKIYLYEKIVE